MLNLLFLFSLVQYLPYTYSQVVIQLYTVKNPLTPINVTRTTVLSNIDGFNMNVNSQNYLIIHGLSGSGENEWILNMKTKLLSVDSANANVFVVDWRIGASPGFLGYQTAVDNLQTSAAETYNVFASLKEYVQYKNGLLNIHCIGHSLGSHFCGFVSKFAIKFLGLKFERISALDPAGPCFEDQVESKRLSKDDADFVDAIHTSILLGYVPPIGHADFYPNGGQFQPGCSQILNQITGKPKNSNAKAAILYLCSRQVDLDSINELIDPNNGSATAAPKFDVSNIFLICSHSRPQVYFTESITKSQSDCSFTSSQCGTWINYLLGRCRTCKQNSMGFNSIKPTESTSYYLKTNSASNFCQTSKYPTSTLSEDYYCFNSSTALDFNMPIILFAFILIIYFQ